jgi:hypothetical protein
MGDCHCGKDGHPLGSVNCPEHGYMTAPKITLAELERMFGGSLPMEAYNLIFEGDGSKTIKQVRAELLEMAKRHQTAAGQS